MSKGDKLTNHLALSMLGECGIATIWRLNVAAADAHRSGHPCAAALIPTDRRGGGGSMAEGRRCAEFVMLLEIFVAIPSLVMAEIAWCVRFAVVLTCLLVLLAVAFGAVGCRRAERQHVMPGIEPSHPWPA